MVQPGREYSGGYLGLSEIFRVYRASLRFLILRPFLSPQAMRAGGVLMHALCFALRNLALVPRVSRAQKLDALTSMANIAGRPPKSCVAISDMPSLVDPLVYFRCCSLKTLKLQETTIEPQATEPSSMPSPASPALAEQGPRPLGRDRVDPPLEMGTSCMRRS